MTAQLEHINVTVADPKAVAALLVDVFGWHVRWEGAAADGAGYTVHVGTADTFVALYTGKVGAPMPPHSAAYHQIASLNHIGVVVDDLGAVEAKVKALGLTPHSHADYEPGHRFYFDTPYHVQIEVVHYGGS